VPQTPQSIPPQSPGSATPHQPDADPKPPNAASLLPPTAVTPAARAGRTWPIVVLRVLSVIILLQVMTQAALAGGFVTGNVNLLGLHSANGITLALTASALLPAAILLVRPGRGPWWPIVFSVAFWWLVTIQIGFGFARLVGLHIPIGVAIMGLISGFTWWSCAYRGTRRARKAAA